MKSGIFFYLLKLGESDINCTVMASELGICAVTLSEWMFSAQYVQTVTHVSVGLINPPHLTKLIKDQWQVNGR